ncbi:protein FAM170A isoform X3 [Tamandua tetradactyla]|uniref:protein FAM170A isoform X3 n=1 Tax=Tamandua tetradactyla TaxID=48850 RepID=UPI00405462C7
MKRRQKRKHLGNEEHQESAEKGEGIWTSQEDALQSRPTGVSKGWGLGLGELSSISEEYFSCVSFPHRLIRGGFWRLHQDSPRSRSPLAQVQMKKGVAVSWEIEETSDSVEKQLRMEEATLPEDVRQLRLVHQKIPEDCVAFSWEREKKVLWRQQQTERHWYEKG